MILHNEHAQSGMPVGCALPRYAIGGAAIVDETMLVRRATAGDEAALSEFVRAHHSKVFGCAMKILRNREAADDAAQETFIRAWKALPNFDRRSAIGTWLYRICVNVCLSRIRSAGRRAQRKQQITEDEERGEGQTLRPRNPEEELQRHQLLELVGKAVDELPETLQITVSMVLLQGVPQHVVAEVMNCSPGTVAWRVHEARRRLRRKLRGEIPPSFFQRSEVRA